MFWSQESDVEYVNSVYQQIWKLSLNPIKEHYHVNNINN